MSDASDFDAAEKRRRLLSAGSLVVLVIALVLSIWRYQRQNAPIHPVTRSTSDFVVEWRCLACGQTLRANAGPGPQECPHCHKREMYASLTWACPQHGSQQVAFQYDSSGNPTQVKMGDGPWKSSTNDAGGWNIRCPVCGGSMMPAG